MPLGIAVMCFLAAWAIKTYGIFVCTSVATILWITAIAFTALQYDIARLTNEVLAPVIKEINDKKAAKSAGLKSE